MSTNFYAQIELSGRHSISSTISLHIGKTGVGTILSGDWFQSFAAWKEFLTHNADKVEIKDEYGTIHSVEALVERFESYDAVQRGRQYNWLQTHPESIGKASDHWLDADGFSFSKGEFF